MRAVVTRGQQLSVEEMPTPNPGPGEALVKTLACGICGSDLHVLRHAGRMADASRRSGGAFRLDPAREFVMGHEFCAEVVDYGPDTPRRFAPGTRVCAMPLLLTSRGLEAVGYSNDVPGGYGQYMRLLAPLLLEVQNGLATEHAALTEPMAVGLHAVAKARLAADDVALVIGCGPVGLAVIAALKLRGVAPIVAADFSPRRRVLALEMGADVVVDPGERSPYASFQEAAVYADPATAPPQPPWMPGPPLRPQVLFECVGVPGVIQQLLEGAARDARIVVVGVCLERDAIEPFFGIDKELNLQFVLGYTPEEFAATLQHIAEGRIRVAPLVTGRTGLDGVADAFAALASPEQHAKILVEPWRG